MSKLVHVKSNWIYQKYWNEKLSTHKIAKLCNVTQAAIWAFMKRDNIPRRSRSEAQWKGGTIKNPCGYIMIHNPDHPNAFSNGYIHRSRLIAEKKLGRFLKKGEITHHKNGIRTDDRPENISVFTQSTHMSKHRDPITGKFSKIMYGENSGI